MHSCLKALHIMSFIRFETLSSIVIFCVAAYGILYFSGLLKALCYGYLLSYVISKVNLQNITIVLKTIPRDLRFLSRAVNGLFRVKLLEKKNTNFVQLFQKTVERTPNKVCFYYGDQQWTYKQVEELTNQIANVFQAKGYGKGDVVALLMSNCPEYVCVWLGLAKIGVVTALLNTNLRDQPLLHCIKSAKAKSVIYSCEYSTAVTDIEPDLQQVERLQFGDFHKNASTTMPVVKVVAGFRDPLLYIYTSGTTGLPKPAIVNNSRCIFLAYATWYVLKFTTDDILYNCLPFYHTSGGTLGIVCTLVFGNATAIRNKFSASQYWTDCIRYKCTLALYIGEMCRYIMSVPPKPEDKQHRVRLIMGNGMRPEVWRQFQDRFQIAQICELYGSTEGNTNLINIDKTVGAVGFLPNILPRFLLPIDLIRVNEAGEPIRGKDGLCIRCKPGEAGTFVGTISTVNSSQEFAGYVGGGQENKKKILENVFKKGDSAFWSGDLLVTDKLGYLYFKDRLGDTFRWKGENVSTAEVEGVIGNATGLLVTVYGVKVAEIEGRAGMAAIVDPNDQLDLEQLSNALIKTLPAYARPLFIRITKEVDMTGTFKLKKIDLQREGFNPEVVKDLLYFRDGSNFVPITSHLYKKVINGEVRV